MLIEATSNTGIARRWPPSGYRMVLIMPEDLSVERRRPLEAFGAELILDAASAA